VPALLRPRVALAVLFGVFLIPVLLSSLRGLTHVVSCRGEVEQPFTVTFGPDGEPLLTGSAMVEGGEGRMCDWLVSELAVETAGPHRLEVTIPITNNGAGAWRGTVQLRVGTTVIPIGIGLVPAGTTKSETVILRLPEGVSSFDGSLLVGP
jgi:hypothetical protein